MNISDLEGKPSGFTLNMSKYVQRGRLKGRFIVTGKDTRMYPYVHSDYSLGYIFGAFLSVGNANLSTYNNSKRGMVIWYTTYQYEDAPVQKLINSVKEAFYLDVKWRRQKRSSTHQLICYSKPLAELFTEFGKNGEKSLPDKYLVNNEDFLKGLYDGLLEFHGYRPDTRSITNKRRFNDENATLFSSLAFWLGRKPSDSGEQKVGAGSR